ncbi:MAG: hypothetical protein KDE24_08490 [Caldilinea sp.]|nr:hypothetical protein [Caldilinea sp.]
MSEVMSETKPTTSVNLLILVVGMAALAVATFFAVYTLTGVLAPPPAPAPLPSANEITSLSGLDFSNVEGAFCKVPVTGESRVLTVQELEDEFGIRVRLIGVTAGGGLIDLRYKVVDLEKALPLLGSHETMPELVDEASGQRLVAPEGVMHHGDLEERVYFMHYPNGGNKVKPGSLVSVVMGDITVEGIAAQ